MEPGFYTDLPAATYHAAPGVSHSMLKKAGPTLSHFKQWFDSKEKFEPTVDMMIGTLVHSLILEPNAPLPRIAIQPGTYTDATGKVKDWTYGATVCKEWRAARHAEGKVVLKAEDYDSVVGVVRAVSNNAESAALLREGVSEVSIFIPQQLGQYNILRRLRLDHVPPGNALADVKTVPLECASKEEFAKKLYDDGYFTQAAYYLDGWNDLGSSPWRPEGWEPKEHFVFIVVEKKPPFAVQCFRVVPKAIEAGRRLNHERLAAIAHAQATNNWPGYPGGYNPIDIPGWAYKQFAREQFED